MSPTEHFISVYRYTIRRNADGHMAPKKSLLDAMWRRLLAGLQNCSRTSRFTLHCVALALPQTAAVVSLDRNSLSSSLRYVKLSMSVPAFSSLAFSTPLQSVTGFPVLRFPPFQYGAAFSSIVFSVPLLKHVFTTW